MSVTSKGEVKKRRGGADEGRKHFDKDVRDLVKVKIVHGFWKRDDERRTNLLVSTALSNHVLRLLCTCSLQCSLQ